VLESGSYLFEPRPTYSLLPRQPKTAHAITTEFDPPSNTGQSPPPGAAVNYYLKAAESGPLKITISGKDGKLIRTLDGPSKAGINRIWWDLHSEPGPASNSRGFDAPTISTVVPPGTYTVSLSVRGESQTARLIVLADPAGQR